MTVLRRRGFETRLYEKLLESTNYLLSLIPFHGLLLHGRGGGHQNARLLELNSSRSTLCVTTETPFITSNALNNRLLNRNFCEQVFSFRIGKPATHLKLSPLNGSCGTYHVMNHNPITAHRLVHTRGKEKSSTPIQCR